MPFSNPIPAIAYASPGARASSPAPTISHANSVSTITNASLTGSADVSSAAPSSHAHPAAPSANTPCNEPQTTNHEPSRTPHFALFLQVLHIAMVVISAIAKRMDSDLHCLTLLQGCEAINCLYSIIRIQLTIDRHPERITPAELRRLAKASRYINRLARRKLDFSPFTTTQDNPPSTDNEQQTPDNKQQATNNKQTSNPQLSLPRLNITGLRSTPVCHSPGATLARTCQSLCRLLKLLPDLAYDPSGTVPTLDLANPATLSLTLGARTPSSAAPLPPTNPATPSPISPFVVPPLGGYAPTPANSAAPSPNPPFNEQQATSAPP